jgi:DNA gyrase subunit A
LDDVAKVISLMVPQEGGQVLTASEKGYGKKTAITEFPIRGRGGMGVIAMQCTERNGGLAGAVQVFDGDDIMLISDLGTMVRTRTSEISSLGRNTQGVRLIRVADDETLIGIARIEEPEESEDSVDVTEEGNQSSEATASEESQVAQEESDDSEGSEEE